MLKSKNPRKHCEQGEMKDSLAGGHQKPGLCPRLKRKHKTSTGTFPAEVCPGASSRVAIVS